MANWLFVGFCRFGVLQRGGEKTAARNGRGPSAFALFRKVFAHAGKNFQQSLFSYLFSAAVLGIGYY